MTNHVQLIRPNHLEYVITGMKIGLLVQILLPGVYIGVGVLLPPRSYWGGVVGWVSWEGRLFWWTHICINWKSYFILPTFYCPKSVGNTFGVPTQGTTL